MKVVRNEVLPILNKQPGFLEIHEREVYPKVEGIVKPYLITPVAFKHYNVETTLCQHFVEALTA